LIFKGSRYATVGTMEVPGPDGRPVVALRLRIIPDTPAGYLHTFSADERLDILAFNFFRNAEKFWLIADANDELDPEDLLEPGRRLRIPPDRG